MLTFPNLEYVSEMKNLLNALNQLFFVAINEQEKCRAQRKSIHNACTKLLKFISMGLFFCVLGLNNLDLYDESHVLGTWALSTKWVKNKRVLHICGGKILYLLSIKELIAIEL